MVVLCAVPPSMLTRGASAAKTSTGTATSSGKIAKSLVARVEAEVVDAPGEVTR